MTAALGPSPLISGDAHLSVDQARAAIAAALQPIHGDETVPLHQALGRVLAEAVISPIDVPAHDNSAMDGYAFASSDLPAPGSEATLDVVATLHAGDVPDFTVPAGGCVRIMTGAVMPAGLDTVVPQELCRSTAHDGGARVTLAAGVVQPGENRRHAGEDLARGKPAVPAGRLLRPAELGLIASLGIARVTVRRRLRVALFSTGNELRDLGQPLDAGCIYDSNRHTLAGALQRLGV
ncbi:MAG: hypothetical protein RLZZ524_1096, partial [Pseudomonadota bacterium]